jgi:hypothetical protein
MKPFLDFTPQEMRPLTESDVKGIHDLYPASEIESIEVFEKLAARLPGNAPLTFATTPQGAS